MSSLKSMINGKAKAVGFFPFLFLFLNTHRFGICCILDILLDTNEMMAMQI